MNYKEQIEKICRLLRVEDFRQKSRGWYRGWIIVPSPWSYYGKMIKPVNGGRRPEIRSAYPAEIVYQDIDSVFIRGG